MLFKLCLIVCVVLHQAVSGERWFCKTPEGEPGECVTLIACPPLMKAFANPKNETMEKLFKYKCSLLLYVVCCGLSPNFTVPQPHEKAKLEVSDLQVCGRDLKSNDRRTHIFPWLAQITLEIEEQPPGYFTGVLINQRYVLTYIYHLLIILYNRLRKTTRLTVRLGDLQQSSTDFAVEQTIIHPFFSLSPSLNALTLLRLDKRVTYSDYIRPICLPTPRTIMPQPGNYLLLVGRYQIGAEIKTNNARIVSTEQCQNSYKGKSNQPITKYNKCTSSGPVSYAQSSCFDAGTPAMFLQNSQWYLASIVNMRMPEQFCESGAIPYIHTDVSKYLEWIQDNVES